MLTLGSFSNVGSLRSYLVFLIFIIRVLSAYADNTRIIYADKASAKIEETINNDPARLDIWLEENGKRRSPAKYQEIGMGKA